MFKIKIIRRLVQNQDRRILQQQLGEQHLRPLTAALALSQGHYRLSGVARMHERPIGDLVEALREAGADIDYLGNPGFPPLAIRPAQAAASRIPATCIRGFRRCTSACRG